jgi:membrane-associated phospholipid phosphatase
MLFSPYDTLWRLLSSLGSANVTVALALALAILLIVDGDHRMARRWLFLFCIAMSAVGVTKLAFVGWGITFSPFDFTGASGHAARAAAVYPVLCFMLSKDHSAAMQRLAVGAALVLAAGIACSRMARQMHTLSEVVSGLGIGLLVAAVCVRRAGDSGRLQAARAFPWLGAAALCAVLMPVAPTQAWLTHVGMALSGRPAPYTREDVQIRQPALAPLCGLTLRACLERLR